MIDYLSLAIGHGLLALALLRLVMRADLDSDPAVEALRDAAQAKREANGVAGRNARRNAQRSARSNARSNIGRNVGRGARAKAKTGDDA